MEKQPEIVINYKRQLSPIIEESEEDTCKTFIMNETVAMDSTRYDTLNYVNCVKLFFLILKF